MLKKLVLFLLITQIFFFSCDKNAITTRNEIKKHFLNSSIQDELINYKRIKRIAIEDYLNTLTQEERVAQLFLVNLEGNESFKPVEELDDKKPLVPGGFIFFSYNIAKKPEQIIYFTDSIKTFCLEHKIPVPYLAIDQEGGEVNRLRGITSILPSNSRVANSLSPELAFNLYKEQAIQLYELGFNMNLAPVAEATLLFNNEFISSRSYGDNEKVLKYCPVMIDAYNKNKITTVIKHFPGNTNVDPHTGLPDINLSIEDWNKLIIEPFKLISYYHPSAILMSHAKTNYKDIGIPACLSHSWITETIYKEYGYNGLIISDDIFMAALEKNGYPPVEAAEKAINSGVNVIMLSEKRCLPVVKNLIKKAKEDDHFAQLLNESEIKVIEYKINAEILEEKLIFSSTENSYKVVITEKKQKTNIEDRINNFVTAKNNGDNFYIQHFTEKLK